MLGWVSRSAAATATPTAETAGTASQWSFGTAVIWAVLIAFLLYALYRRFG